MLLLAKLRMCTVWHNRLNLNQTFSLYLSGPHQEVSFCRHRFVVMAIKVIACYKNICSQCG